jgi:hypothetical protein
MRWIAGIAEYCDARKASEDVLEQLHPLSRQRIARRHREACEISVRARETRRESIRDRIYGQRENDWNGANRALAGFRRRGSVDHDDLDIRAHKLGRKFAQPIVSARRVALLDEDVLAFDIAPRAQPLAESIELLLVRARLPQKADARELLLRTHRERP